MQTWAPVFRRTREERRERAREGEEGAQGGIGGGVLMCTRTGKRAQGVCRGEGMLPEGGTTRKPWAEKRYAEAGEGSEGERHRPRYSADSYNSGWGHVGVCFTTEKGGG